MKGNYEQAAYILGAVGVAPLLPFLYWQGRQTRRKVGRLPDAVGEITGKFAAKSDVGETELNLLAIGESTVAGVGARNHGEALAGQLARFLSLETGKSVGWRAVGESGITAGESLRRLVPLLPDEPVNLVVVALGGNDAFQVNSPNRFGRDMEKLVEKIREKYPRAAILLANTPMVRDFPVLPQPLKTVLWRVSRLHHRAMKRLSARAENVFYFDEAGKAPAGFFADGVHPSALGYALWSEAMIRFLLGKTDF